MREIKFRVYIKQVSDLTEGKEVGIMVYSDGRTVDEEKQFFCYEFDYVLEWLINKDGKIMFLVPQEFINSEGDVFVDVVEAYPLSEIDIPTGKMWFSELMLYTGLKDDYGQEIYEGDLLVIRDITVNDWTEKYWKYHFYGDNKPIVVEFENGSFVGKVGYDACFLYDLVSECDVEVIGNIYENKDLLKNK